MASIIAVKNAWYLASSRTDLTGAEAKRLYGLRFNNSW